MDVLVVSSEIMLYLHIIPGFTHICTLFVGEYRFMTLEDLRLEAHLSVAALSRKAGVDMKTVKRAIDGEPVQKVKAVAIVDALSKELERPLKLEDIEGIHYAY